MTAASLLIATAAALIPASHLHDYYGLQFGVSCDMNDIVLLWLSSPSKWGLAQVAL